MQLPVRFRISRLVTSLVYQLKHSERRRSPALIFAEAETLKKIKHYQKMLVNNMAYSRVSLNHVQLKTNRLLTIAVIRKRRRWTSNMAVAWIVSSGEHFVVVFDFFFFFLFSSLRQKYLGTFETPFCATNIIPITQIGSYINSE